MGIKRMNNTKMIKKTTAQRVKPPNTPSILIPSFTFSAITVNACKMAPETDKYHWHQVYF
ncbi:hypothetical protein DNHGIG_32610 [Collibacillus ludicampi]|uniref:Uncharacterized protein n=1 Tax=Collibacillus ludicampi TaxID=2771369 RepID=A0AAV4LK07_9BACL|nr:hypothetical protein DNHGIG_32610 [Collibacillus ludicampi]